MKLLLMIVLIALYTHASAQTIRLQTPDRNFKINSVTIDKRKFDSLIKILPYQSQNSYSFNLKLNTGLNHLADGMPCIVPEPPTAGLIPNVWHGKVQVPFRQKEMAMPNPAVPGVYFSYRKTISKTP
jgi:hypothetical protein